MAQFSKSEVEYLKQLVDSDYFRDDDPEKDLKPAVTSVLLNLKGKDVTFTVTKEAGKSKLSKVDFLLKTGRDSEPIPFYSFQAVFRYIFYLIKKEGFETDEIENEQEE